MLLEVVLWNSMMLGDLSVHSRNCQVLEDIKQSSDLQAESS